MKSVDSYERRGIGAGPKRTIITAERRREKGQKFGMGLRKITGGRGGRSLSRSWEEEHPGDGEKGPREGAAGIKLF